MPPLPLLFALACESTESIEGKVVDIWGDPVEGATVMIVGGTERPMTDSNGRYRIARAEGRLEMKAGCKGYIQDHEELVVEPGQREVVGPLFELYPKPEASGFNLVDTGRYLPMAEQRVRSVGNALAQFRGIADHGEVVSEKVRPRVVLHTDTRQDQLQRLGLKLRRLKYLAEAAIPGPTGEATVAVNLWVDDGPVETELVALRSKTDFLVQPVADLPAGTYAYETVGLLSGAGDEDDGFSSVPEELRVVFPFEIR